MLHAVSFDRGLKELDSPQSCRKVAIDDHTQGASRAATSRLRESHKIN